MESIQKLMPQGLDKGPAPSMAAQLQLEHPGEGGVLEAGPLLPIPSCLPQTPHFLLPIFSTSPSLNPVLRQHPIPAQGFEGVGWGRAGIGGSGLASASP